MPVPAVPAPKTTRRWSLHRSPVTFMPEMTDDMTIAPVRCMSSSKIRYQELS